MTRAVIVIAALGILLPAAVLAGQSVAVKQPPTDFDLCVAQANAHIAELTSLNKTLEARVKALEHQVGLLEKPEPAKKAKKTVQKRLPCKPGRTRNAKGQCGRWG